MEQDSMIFYRSFYEAICLLPRDIQGEIYTAIMEYGLNGRETENLKPIARSVFLLVKPQIDANKVRRENGEKGGAPKGSRNNPNGRKGKKVSAKELETNQEPTENKPKTNRELTENKPRTNRELTKNKPNVNDNVNVNVNDNVVDVVEAREGEKNSYGDFLGQFFADGNHRLLETLCMQMHTDTATLRRLADDTVAEWQLTRQQHSDYTEMSKHLINQMRIKLKQNGTNKPNSAAKGEPGGVRQDAAPKRPLRSTI